MEYGKLNSYVQKDNRVVITFEKQQVILEILKDDIINIFVPIWSESHRSKAIEEKKEIPTDFTVSQQSGILSVDTDKLKIEIQDNFQMDIYKSDGTLLLGDYHGERTYAGAMSEEALKQVAAEGHDTTNLKKRNYKVQTVKVLDKEDSFYGLGDKSGFLNKREYEYENWNTDNPQAHTEDFHALYKSIPFLICKKKNSAYGLFFDNTFHSYINLGKESPKYFYYGADDGNLDYYFLGGETLAEIITNYTWLTGTTPLPQRWTLGYHQSRWGYICAEDIREVAEKYRELQIPCDVIHLDIDYMEAYKVFTWNEKEYGKPGELFKELKAAGYKPVTIIDPGTKLEPGYFMYEEGMKNGYFAKDKDGSVYVNVVWPGEANYPDFGRKEVRDWWGNHHKVLVDMGVSGIWNDMNEPASFRGELPLDVVFHEEERETDHAEIHNVYGHFMAKATFEALKEQTGKRPFVITRACYAGTQKYSTVWTGDNQSLWAHLQMVIPQLCNLGMSGFSFCGTDIGGFGADTTPELLCRWIEAACFSPLFRNHSAKGTRQQEPWQFEQEVIDINRKYIELRYRFLPYIYDLFYQGEKTGLPVMRPLVLHYEDDPEVRNLNGEFMVGEQIIVAPVLEQGATKKMVYLPEGIWYDYWTGEKITGGKYFLRDAPLDCCPIYIKAGSMIPMYEPMQYVGEKLYDTLYVLTTPGEGVYEHFQDNGEDYAYQQDVYNLYRFTQDTEGNVKTELIHEKYPKYDKIILEPLGNGCIC